NLHGVHGETPRASTNDQTQHHAMSIKQSSKEPGSSREAIPSNMPPCWERERDRDCLRLEKSEGEELLLPYQHFLGAHFRPQKQMETLTITFSSHSITPEGWRLEEIVAALQEYAVDWIAPTPQRYQSLRDADAVTILKLEIKAAE
ncbi:MAG: hypothetical protein ABI680_05900, partial [Chthoniobacteraceae bacterium]